MSVIAGMLKRGSWTNAGEELVMESTGRRGPKVQSLEGQYSASRALGACSTRRSLTLPPIHLPAVASIPLAVPICVGYEQEMIAPRFISCIFILQSLLGSVGFPDYQYLKIYVLFPGLFLVLPSSYMKIPPPTYLWDSWSCREHFTPLLKLLWCIVRPLASQPPRPRWGWLCPGTSALLGGDFSCHCRSWGKMAVIWADLKAFWGSRSVSKTRGRHPYFGAQGATKFIPGSAPLIYPRMDSGR